MRKYLILTTILALSFNLLAQPTSITWQGKLLDASGNAITQNNVSMNFAMFDASTGGNQLWPISGTVVKAVNVVNGLYSVPLGTGNGDDIAFAAAMFNGKTPWLEVKVGAETLPRTEITNVPFALISNDLSATGWENPGKIGKTTPNTGKFTSVETGSVKVSDGASAGKVLTSDADGNASWTTPTSSSLTNFTESNFTYDTKTGVKLLATNDATNVDLVITPKGNGAILARQPDGAATGGNTRGNYAVDLQLLRTNNTEVASGDFSVISGGLSNTSGGNMSTTGGGYGNISGGNYSTTGGGLGNISNGEYSTVNGGFSNTAGGNYSTISGKENRAPSYGETVFGYLNTIYTPETDGATQPNPTDRLFTVGNGDASSRSNAITILKNANTTIGGTLAINDNVADAGFTFPTGRGTNGQFLKTDGAGATSWTSLTNADVGLGNVENTTLSTWEGSANLARVGTIAFGTWNGDVIGINKGGTGATTKAASFNALSPMNSQGDLIYGGAGGTGTRLAKGTASQMLRMNAGATAPEWVTLTKTDIGLGSVENTALSTWAGSANITTLGTITTGAWNGTAITVAKGGTGATTKTAGFDALSPMTTAGDIIYGGTSGSGTRLAKGTASQLLRMNAGATAPEWVTFTKTDLGLGNVENTALSTWTGSANITTVGTIATGTWSGTAIAVAKGGTGATTKTAGFDALSPMTAVGDLIYGGTNGAGTRLPKGTPDQVLAMNFGATAPTWITLSKSDVGLGNVENTALTTWTGSTSITTLGTISTGTWSGTTIGITKGGTGAVTKTAGFDALSPMTTAGDIIYGGTSGSGTRLGKGTAGQVLRMNSGATAPEWATPYTGLTNFTESNYSYSSKFGVKFLATNPTTNIDFVISPKGEGGILAKQPDGTAAGGNNRGSNAVDLQTTRLQAAQVASGTKSVISGGGENTASGMGSTVIGGIGNTASGEATIAGGYYNTASYYGETVFGMYSTTFTLTMAPGAAPNWRLFNIGNGWSDAARSDAFSVFSSGDTKVGGSLTINALQSANSLTLPATRGTSGQLLASDGTGKAYWVSTDQGLTNITESVYNYDSKTGIKLLPNNAETDVDFVISPKGSGALMTQQPDGGAAGGSNRGENAVDLQTSRSEAGQVASGNYSVISGGSDNGATGDFSSVSGGKANFAASMYSSVGGGYSNTANGLCSVISGGTKNTTNGKMAAVFGGENNSASGNNSAIVYGNFMNTNNKTGAVMLGDNSTTTPTLADANNQFTTRFAGGYKFYTNPDLLVGVHLAADGNSWSTISDSAKKENYKHADEESILRSFRDLRLGSWNYKGQQKETNRHYGPMAQEWNAAFGFDGIGKIGCDTTLASADVDGVAYIAIKGLERRTAEQEITIRRLQKEIDELRIALASSQDQNKVMMEKFAGLAEKLDRLMNSRDFSSK